MLTTQNLNDHSKSTRRICPIAFQLLHGLLLMYLALSASSCSAMPKNETQDQSIPMHAIPSDDQVSLSRSQSRGLSEAQGSGPLPEVRQDCSIIGETEQRESCLAVADDFKNCSESDLQCAPYRKMHTLDLQLRMLNIEVAQRANKSYVSYLDADPAYLNDLADLLKRSDEAWRAYRDADCSFEPFSEGMSRRESSDLTEACRVERTEARIEVLSKMMKSMN